MQVAIPCRLCKSTRVFYICSFCVKKRSELTPTFKSDYYKRWAYNPILTRLRAKISKPILYDEWITV